MTNKLRTAIIGCGSIHHTHAKALRMMDNAEIVVVADIREDRAKASAEENGCEYVTDYKELIARQDIDVVHICTPHYLHAPMAIDMLKSGKNVFCEKPMSITVEDAKAMIEAEKSSGKKLGICFQNRYNNTSRRMKELISSGEAGKILGARAQVTWHRTPEYYTESGWRGSWKTEGGGTLINQSIHTLDLLQWVCGPAVSIKGKTDRFLLGNTIEVEDTAMANLMFANGANGLFYATNCNAIDDRVEVTVYCEKATLSLRGEELTVSWKDGKTEQVSNKAVLVGEKSYWGSGHLVAIRDFYRCVQEGESFPIPPTEGIHAISLLQGIYESEKKGDYVPVI